MARVVDQVKLEAWRRRLVDFQSSGLSVAAFCRRENIGPTRFYYWSGKLREAGMASDQAAAIARGPLGSGSSTASLPGGGSADTEKVGSEARVEIFVGNSIRLCMPLGEPEAIAAIVQILRKHNATSSGTDNGRATAVGASTLGAFRRIEVVSGR